MVKYASPTLSLHTFFLSALHNIWSSVGLPKTVAFIGEGYKYCHAALGFTGVEGNGVKLKNILVA